MKTDDLIHLLATQAGPVQKHLFARSLLPAAALALGFSGLVTWVALGWVPMGLLSMAGMQLKLAYVSILALGSGVLLYRLGKPGLSVGVQQLVVFFLPVLMLLYGALGYMLTPEDQKATALWGHSYLTCPWTIAALSVPGLWAAFWASSKMAPTRIRLTGAVCGLFAGALGAAGYALACSEVAVPFVALWYTLGIGLVTVLGALLAPRFIRW
jgi:hypothetical protein